MVRGYQGEGADDPTSIAACAKHFVGYGASESGRDYNSTNLTERQLRNVYLPPFEQAVRSGAMTLMTSFNDNDGIPSTGNRFLLEEVLRNEWGFDGMVVTDWNSAGEMVSHGFAADTKDAAMKAINAGVDMDMMSHVFSLHLKDLIDEGTVDERRLDEAVRNILRVKFRLGLFENPYIDTARIARVTYAPEHLEAARRTAEESAVLLRNEGSILPRFFPSTQFNYGIFVALFCVAAVTWMLYKTPFGFSLRAMGQNPRAMQQAGLPIYRRTLAAMCISGGLFALGGAIQCLAVYKRFVMGFSPGYGWDGITVATLAMNSPVGVLLSAFLFGMLRSASISMSLTSQVTTEMISVLQGFIVMLVASPDVWNVLGRLCQRIGIRRKQEGAAE